jgi:O-antigen/teichoic acid export membrane protein
LISHVFKVQPNLIVSGVIALRIAAALILVRLVESVLIGAVRAHEIYRPVVLVSVAARVTVVVAILILVGQGHGLVAILWATLAGGMFSAGCQSWIAQRVLGGLVVSPSQIREGIKEIAGFGTYAWLKSAAGVAFAYGDRLLVGAVLGTAPLAFYGLCNQITQPIHALIAAAYNYVFPNLGVQAGANQWQEVQRNYRRAAIVSCCVIVGVCLPLALASRWIVTLWLGTAAAQQSATLLVLLTLGNGLLATCVVPHYAALAVGRSRALAYINFAAGAGALAVGYGSMRVLGLNGAGLMRITSGVVSLSIYQVVRHTLRPRLRSTASPRSQDGSSGLTATSEPLQAMSQTLADC